MNRPKHGLTPHGACLIIRSCFMRVCRFTRPWVIRAPIRLRLRLRRPIEWILKYRSSRERPVRGKYGRQKSPPTRYHPPRRPSGLIHTIPFSFYLCSLGHYKDMQIVHGDANWTTQSHPRPVHTTSRWSAMRATRGVHRTGQQPDIIQSIEAVKSLGGVLASVELPRVARLLKQQLHLNF